MDNLRPEHDLAAFNRSDLFYKNIFEGIYGDIKDSSYKDNIYQYTNSIKQLLLYTTPFFIKDKEKIMELSKRLSEARKTAMELYGISKRQMTVSQVKNATQSKYELMEELDDVFLQIWYLMHKYNLLVFINRFDSRPVVVKSEY